MDDLQRTMIVLSVLRREMLAFGRGWRWDWSDFDGRTLREQLHELDKWAGEALSGKADLDYREGSDFLEQRIKGDD